MNLCYILINYMEFSEIMVEVVVYNRLFRVCIYYVEDNNLNILFYLYCNF